LLETKNIETPRRALSLSLNWARMEIQRIIPGPRGPTKRARARSMRRHGTSFRLPSFACRVSSHQRLFRHVRGRIALYGRDESARLVPHPPRPSFKRSHDPSRVCVCARAGRTARPMSLRSTDGRTDGGVSNHTERGEVGARTRGKLMEPRPCSRVLQRDRFYPARARARAPPARSARSPDVATMAAGGILDESGLGLGEDG